MSDISDKVAYVKNQGQTRNHECHWPGCKTQVAPALWGCKEHWYQLPEYLRMRVWASYRIGQEVEGTPSDTYMEVMMDIQRWINENRIR